MTITSLTNKIPTKILSLWVLGHLLSVIQDTFLICKLTTNLALRVSGCSVFTHVNNREKLDP